LGENVRICLEPPDRLARAEDPDSLWVFNPATGVSGRGDGKFFQVEYVDRGGWGQLAIREEPNAPQGRTVGQVVVQVNAKNQVRFRRTKGLNGEVLELHPSSLSKGELVEHGAGVGLIETNPQRIIGTVQALLVYGEFPDEEAMWVTDFIEQSTDGRSLAALLALGVAGE
jgi:hypothetical protein